MPPLYPISSIRMFKVEAVKAVSFFHVTQNKIMRVTITTLPLSSSITVQITSCLQPHRRPPNRLTHQLSVQASVQRKRLGAWSLNRQNSTRKASSNFKSCRSATIITVRRRKLCLGRRRSKSNRAVMTWRTIKFLALAELIQLRKGAKSRKSSTHQTKRKGK